MKKSPMRNKLLRPVPQIRSKTQFQLFREMLIEYFEDRAEARRLAELQMIEDRYNYELQLY